MARPLTRLERANAAMNIAGHNVVELISIDEDRIDRLSELVDEKGAIAPDCRQSVDAIWAEHVEAMKGTDETTDKAEKPEATQAVTTD